jgi:hypothetical protein
MGSVTLLVKTLISHVHIIFYDTDGEHEEEGYGGHIVEGDPEVEGELSENESGSAYSDGKEK